MNLLTGRQYGTYWKKYETHGEPSLDRQNANPERIPGFHPGNTWTQPDVVWETPPLRAGIDTRLTKSREG